MLIGFMAWLVFGASMFLAPLLKISFLPAVFFIPFIGTVMVQMFFVRCPRCNGNLGLLLSQTMSLRTLKPRVINCPFCGVDFSEHP